MYEKGICSIRMPTPHPFAIHYVVYLMNEKKNVMTLCRGFFYFLVIRAPFACNATLGTTHAFMRYCVPSFSFFGTWRTLCRERDSGNASGVHALQSLLTQDKDAHNRSHHCGRATVAILWTTILKKFDHH